MPWRSGNRTQGVVRGVLDKSGVNVTEIAAIGITNQRETTLVWERATGRPVYNAIVWQDTRTDVICNELAKEGGQDRFRAKTGLPLATYFSGPKIKWILDNVPGVRQQAEKGRTALREYGYLDPLEYDRRACHRCDQCLPHTADESEDARLG